MTVWPFHSLSTRSRTILSLSVLALLLAALFFSSPLFSASVNQTPANQVCPTTNAVCLGIRSGDVNGDGKADTIGLTLPTNEATMCNSTMASVKARCHITIRVLLHRGALLQKTVTLSPYCLEACSLKVSLLGLTALMNSRLVIAISPDCDAYECPVQFYQIRGTQLQVITFLGGRYIDQVYVGDIGFICSVQHGVHQVETLGFVRDSEGSNVEDDIYMPHGTTMQSVHTSFTTYNLVPLRAKGPRCPGLQVSS